MSDKSQTEKCRPIFKFKLLTEVEKQRIEALAPDRTVGVLAAYAYLSGQRVGYKLKVEETK